MVCPFCQAARPRVAKVNPDGKSDPRRTYRRRFCLACRRRWRTVEIVDLSSPNNGQAVGSPWRNNAAARNGRGQFVAPRPVGPPPALTYKGHAIEWDEEGTPEGIAAQLRADPLG